MQTFPSGGKAIGLHIHEPAGPGPFPAIVLLHGAGGNALRWHETLANAFAPLGVALYAINYFDRTGTTFADPATILDGIHVPLWLATVADALDHIASRPKVKPRRIALLGVSLGGFLACATGTQRQGIRAMVELSGGLASPWAEAATGTFPPTLIVHGDADTTVPVSQAHALDALLERLGVTHEALILAGEGHWFSPDGHMRILAAISTFLNKQLNG